ncbi:MAG: 3-deoxy-D-manno-octulosonic acid transferase [Nitratiruptor sp.]|nr:3-deoxy-D-manno-octulosonic acid transferase [Nitratiruptor sp.]NPA83753.1 3-deoxy-D-manno-octulosonic acid transferase [Campylobacterota bacterium]
MFPYLYTAATACLNLLALPLLPLFALRPKYRRSLPARFFPVANPPLPGDGIHLHACSLGEVRALAPLMDRLSKPRVSVVTQTGYEAAKGYGVPLAYLPFEPWLWLWLRPQRALVVMEAELWYLLFFLAKRRGAKTILLNGRISDRSYPKYRRFAWFYRRLLSHVDLVLAQTTKDRERFKELGAKRVEVAGNVKFLARPVATGRYPKPEGRLIVAASTHDPEEEIIATAWIEAGRPGRLLIVPRHPERFDEVDQLLNHIAKREGIGYHRLSQRGDLEGDLILADRMGELVEFYSIADLVVLGGSFVPHVGGHNPIEAAHFQKPIVSGPYYYNQESSYAGVEGITIADPQELAKFLKTPLPPSRIVQGFDVGLLVKELEDVV